MKAKNPQNADSKRNPTLKAARLAAMERRESGPWPRFFWRSDRQRRPGEGELRYKTYDDEVKEGVVPTTFWASDDFELLDLDAMSWAHDQSGTTDTGLKELNAIVGRGHGFDTVKPLMLFQKIIQPWCPNEGLVLDPFAGSEPVKTFETTGRDYVCKSVLMVGLLIQAATGSFGGVGRRPQNRRGLAA